MNAALIASRCGWWREAKKRAKKRCQEPFPCRGRETERETASVPVAIPSDKGMFKEPEIATTLSLFGILAMLSYLFGYPYAALGVLMVGVVVIVYLKWPLK